MSAADDTTFQPPARPKPRPLPNLGLRLGVFCSLLLLLVAFVSLTWTPYPLDPAGVPEQLLSPSLQHWLGTDQQGRDLLSLAMRGMLTSFVVSAMGTAIGLLFGVPLGLLLSIRPRLAGRPRDLPLLFPAVLVGVLVAARLGPGAPSAILAIGIAATFVFASVTGGVAARLARRPYVDAARLAGMDGWEAAGRHVLPELSQLLLVRAVLQLAAGILAEATLAYVGVGTQPPGTSLGLMLREAQPLLLLEPQLAIVPGAATAAMALSLGLVAHGLMQWLEVDHAAA